jgi:hypothetical protein
VTDVKKLMAVMKKANKPTETFIVSDLGLLFPPFSPRSWIQTLDLGVELTHLLSR